MEFTLSIQISSKRTIIFFKNLLPGLHSWEKKKISKTLNSSTSSNFPFTDADFQKIQNYVILNFFQYLLLQFTFFQKQLQNLKKKWIDCTHLKCFQKQCYLCHLEENSFLLLFYFLGSSVSLYILIISTCG